MCKRQYSYLVVKKFIFNAKNDNMKIEVVMKNYSNIQTLFKIKLKHEFRIMIIIIKLNIENQGFFTTIQIRAKN